MAHYKPVKVKQHASNYNYKSRKNLGSRIKNFFTIPEEDLKEEESPKFEKIKLFRLNRGIIFLSILVFMFLINILVGFNINFLYLRQILGFLFLILIPGLLIMLCFKIRTVGFWEYLVYTVGLSVAFIMFAGLAVNWTLPALNITDKPLSLWPILICFNIFLLILWAIAIIRNKDLKAFDVTIPKLDTINKIFFIIPMAFPLLSILGAFLLNNHGPNILTMIMIGGIAVYVLLLVIFRKHMNENIWPWALYFMGLGLLLSLSMRSWHILGWDSFRELYVFNLARDNFLWQSSIYHNDYNSCLSLTILPLVLKYFTNIPDFYLFKILFEIIFSFTLIIIFLTTERYISKILSFFTVFFFMLPVGFYDLSILFRQQIAFLSFGLMILILFSKKIASPINKLIFVIFGASMIISHYSTAYISLAMFTLTYILVQIYKKIESNKIKRGKISELQRSEFFLTGFLILLLLIFGFLWYAQITDASSSLIKTFHISIDNFKSSVGEELKDKDASIGYHLNPFYIVKDDSNIFNNYLQGASKTYEQREDIITNSGEYSSHLIIQETSPPLNYKLYKNFYYFERILKSFIKMAILLGILLLFFNNFSNIKRKFELEFKIFSIMFGVLLGGLFILPILSLTYDIGRFFQQMLLPLSILGIIGILFLLNLFRFNKKIKFIFLYFLLILVFLFSSGFISEIIGGNPSLELNNMGSSYNGGYSHKYDFTSASWLKINRDISYKISADRISEKRLMALSMNTNLRDIIPGGISKLDYVYAGYTNIIKKMATKDYNAIYLTYNFPIEFLHDNKNKVYSNGESEIFK